MKLQVRWVAYEIGRWMGDRFLVNNSPDRRFSSETFMGLQDLIKREGVPGVEYSCTQVLVLTEKE